MYFITIQDTRINLSNVVSYGCGNVDATIKIRYGHGDYFHVQFNSTQERDQALKELDAQLNRWSCPTVTQK